MARVLRGRRGEPQGGFAAGEVAGGDRHVEQGAAAGFGAQADPVAHGVREVDVVAEHAADHPDPAGRQGRDHLGRQHGRRGAGRPGVRPGHRVHLFADQLGRQPAGAGPLERRLAGVAREVGGDEAFAVDPGLVEQRAGGAAEPRLDAGVEAEPGAAAVVEHHPAEVGVGNVDLAPGPLDQVALDPPGGDDRGPRHAGRGHLPFELALVAGVPVGRKIGGGDLDRAPGDPGRQVGGPQQAGEQAGLVGVVALPRPQGGFGSAHGAEIVGGADLFDHVAVDLDRVVAEGGGERGQLVVGQALGGQFPALPGGGPLRRAQMGAQLGARRLEIAGRRARR